MGFRYAYISAVLILSVTKILHCQEGSLILWDKDCPEPIREKWQHPDTLWDADSLRGQLFIQGYPFAAVEEVESTSDGRKYQVDCGPEINYVVVKWQGDSIGYVPPDYPGKAVYRWDEILNQRESVILDMARSGYPYARLLTVPRKIHHDSLVLEYALDTIRTIQIHEITTSGSFNINPALFRSMIGLEENQRFDVDRIKRSEQIIRRWDFASLETIRYDFNPYGVNLEYVIEENNPSRFDLLIALIPSNRPGQQYELTGNAYIDLQNQLKMAERIYLKFDKYANSSQSIDIRLNFPHLPLLRSGILAEGLLDRRDSSVLDVRGKIGVQYSWNKKSTYAFFLERAQSRLITLDEGILKRKGLLPEELDYNYTAAGISIDHNLLDNRINPRRGHLFRTSFTGGIRQIVQNGKILALKPEGENAIPFARQYENLQKSTARTAAFVSWDQFIPVGMYSAFRFRVMGEWLWASGGLLENEKLRLGGFQDFRGFPEKVFPGDGYGEGTIEYRFLFGVESNAYLFSDFGLLHNTGVEQPWNFPYSVGVGLNLGTKAGIFGISYAIGGHRHVPFSLDQSRINFGLVVNY